MIRTADAAGFDGVMLSKASADLYSLKTLRSMQGSHFHIPIWKLDREELLERAAHSHLAVLATTCFQKLPLTTVSFLRPISLSLVMGMKEMASAGNGGTSRPTGSLFPCQVGQSLNVTVAAGILMFSLKEIFEKRSILNLARRS